MPILQQQPRKIDAPVQIIAASLDPPQDLEYPHSFVPAKTSHTAMPIALWSLGLLLGLLMLLVRSPINAPDFEQLTQYVCDSLPPLPRLGNRSQSYSLRLRCRAGDQMVYQRQAVFDGSNPGGLKACKQEGGLTRIWRMPPPSAYGGYVFHSTCGDHIIMYYKNRAATYESTQRFVISLAGIIMLVSAMMIMHKVRQTTRATRPKKRLRSA